MSNPVWPSPKDLAVQELQARLAGALKPEEIKSLEWGSGVPSNQDLPCQRRQMCSYFAHLQVPKRLNAYTRGSWDPLGKCF